MGIPYKKQFVKPDGRKLVRSGPRDMQSRAATAGGGTDPELIALLTNQISDLKAEILALKSRTNAEVPPGFFSPEQVDEEIRKAVEQAVSQAAVSFKGKPTQNQDLAPLVKEYKTQIVELQRGNDNLTKLHATITKENSGLKEEINKLKSELTDITELQKQIAVLEEQVKGKEEMIDTLRRQPAILGDGPVETDPDRPQMEQVFVDPLEEDSGDGMKSTIHVETITKEDQVDDKVDKLRGLLGKKLPNI
jgi:chromosome segregation ATPase